MKRGKWILGMLGLDWVARWLPAFGGAFALFACGQVESSPHPSGVSGQGAGGSPGTGGASGGLGQSGDAAASGGNQATSPACYESNAPLGARYVDADKAVTQACQNQGHALTRAELEPLLGTYEVTHFTYNARGCNNEGASCLVLGQSIYAIITAEVMGSELLQLDTCGSLAACAAGNFDGNAFAWLPIALPDGSPCSLQFGTGYHDPSKAVCHNTSLVDTRLSRIDSTHLRFTEREALFDAPETDTGACSSGTAETVPEAPCSKLRVLDLHWIQP